MKTTVISLAFAIIAVFVQSGFTQGTCASGGPKTELAPAPPYYGSSPVSSVPPITGSSPTQSQAAVPAVPRARITVVTEASAENSASHRVPSARLILVADPTVDSSLAAVQIASAVVPDSTKAVEQANAVEESEEQQGKMPSVLQGLVGTWLAVARQNDGELTTIELQLDNRGWAKLTIPGSDGKPSSTEHRVEYEDEELKLKGPEGEQSLGKLMESNGRQMVLARTDGRVTFVRL